MYLRFFLNMTFHGISFFTGKLAGNPYVNFIISNVVEIIGILLIQLTVGRFGRKLPYATALAIAATILIVEFFIPLG